MLRFHPMLRWSRRKIVREMIITLRRRLYEEIWCPGTHSHGKLGSPEHNACVKYHTRLIADYVEEAETLIRIRSRRIRHGKLVD